MSYRIRVACNDCTGVDEQGCFGGGFGWVTFEAGRHQLFDGATDVSEAAIFATKDQAQTILDKLAEEMHWAGPWVAKVVGE